MPQPSDADLRSWWFGQLVEALEALSGSYEEQRSRLDESSATVPDAGDLGSDFSDFARFAPELAEFGYLSNLATTEIASLDAYLQSLSGPANAKFWFFGSLAKDPRWDDIRERARSIIRLIRNAPPEPGS